MPRARGTSRPESRGAEVSTTVVLFTRDLRVHDNPALHAAVAGAAEVVPLFVLDDRVLARFGAPNRVAFLRDALADLRHSLVERGGDLVVRRGDAVAEAIGLAVETGATRIHLSEDVSAFAQERQHRLRRAAAEHRISVQAFPGITVVPPGDVAPALVLREAAAQPACEPRPARRLAAGRKVRGGVAAREVPECR